MAAERVELDSHEVSKVIKWLEKHCDARCPVCKEQSLEVQLYLAELRVFRWGELSLKDGVYPQVAVLCVNCGHTLLFSAGALDLIPNREEGGSNAE